jgi:hypothetical protein
MFSPPMHTFIKKNEHPKLIICINILILESFLTHFITTLTLGSWLNVECKHPWGQENVFKCETHFHK